LAQKSGEFFTHLHPEYIIYNIYLLMYMYQLLPLKLL